MEGRVLPSSRSDREGIPTEEGRLGARHSRKCQIPPEGYESPLLTADGYNSLNHADWTELTRL